MGRLGETKEIFPPLKKVKRSRAGNLRFRGHGVDSPNIIALMHKVRVLSILTVLALAGAVFPQAWAQGNEIIYSNTLQNGWAVDPWTGTTSSLTCTSPVLPGFSDSISASCASYAALYLAQTPSDSTPYTNLTFWLNGGASGGQVLTVTGTLNGNNETLVTLPALAANTWRQFTISLADLGVAGQSDFDGIWIWNYTGSAISTFYVDDIVLVDGPPPGPSPTNFIGIDVGSNRHPISPQIYGTAFATSNQLADLNFTMNRSGGNEESTYNWQINAHGKGNDYYFESYPDASSTPGATADSFVADSKNGGAQAMITVPMIGWAPVLGAGRGILYGYDVTKYGPQTSVDPYRTNAGNGISVTNKTPITWNTPTDANMVVNTAFEQSYVQHLIGTWGASTNGGVGYYLMDNEHSLWSSTHQDIHPVGPTMQEIWSKILATASMVKSNDPNALVLGPEEWGWLGYFYSGYDQQWAAQNNDYTVTDFPDRGTNGGWDYMPWLLNQFYQYHTNTGQRLLDYFTLHCYPQEGNVGGTNVDTATELLRNQTTRQFWDSNYVDPSWIGSVIMLIPRMQSWVSNYYPGTKIGITEYNWGAEPSINGATAQADILGIFGRQGLDLATRWTTPDASTPTYLAMKMYRNYDGLRSAFGDTSVLAGGPNPDNIAVFAAQRSTDEALTVMVVNKNLTGTTPLAINITNFLGNGTVQAWQLNASNVIAQLGNLTYSNGTLQTTVPAPSITLLVFPPSAALNLTPGAPRADGQFEFWVNGEIGRSFVLQSSPDLVHWMPASTNTFAGTNAQFLSPGGARAQFYRAALSH
jgi:hypothetical protein